MSEAKELNKLFFKVPGEPQVASFDNVTGVDCQLDTRDREGKYDRLLVKKAFLYVRDPHNLMQGLHLCAKPGASLLIVTPYGSSDAAFEDLSILRVVFKETYRQFWPQWQYTRRVFHLDRLYPGFQGADEEQIGMIVANLRNVVKEFVVELTCLKGAIDIGAERPEPATGFKFI